MTLEKTKKTTTKIKKSQLQKQKQTQNVVVNVNAPVKKATRKRPIKKPPQLKPVQKTPFQSPIYMPPIASFNPPKQPDNTSILSDLLKIINKPIPKPEPNELEKPKPEEREPAPRSAPTLPAVFQIPQQRVSLADEVKSDPLNTRQTFIITPVFEAPKEPLKFKAPLTAEPKPPTLVQTINIGQEKKFEPERKQKWAEVETGGHFVLPEAKATPTLVPTLIEEARPTSEEIDLGIVPQMAGEIVQEDRVENDEPPILQIMVEEPKQESLIPEKIATKSNTQQIQMKALTMGEEKPFLKSFLHSTPMPSLNTIPFTKDELDSMRESRVKALEKHIPVKYGPDKKLELKQEA